MLQYHNFVNMVFNSQENAEKSHVAIIRTRTGSIAETKQEQDDKSKKNTVEPLNVEEMKSTQERLREGFVVKSPEKRRERPNRQRRESPLSTSRSQAMPKFKPPEQNLKTARESLLRSIGDKAREGQDFESMFRTFEIKDLKLNTFRGALKDLGIGSTRALAKATFEFLDKDRTGTVSLDHLATEMRRVASSKKPSTTTTTRKLSRHVSKKSSFHMPKDMVIQDLNNHAMVSVDDVEAFDDFRHKHMNSKMTEDLKKRFWINQMLENEITSPQLRNATRGIARFDPNVRVTTTTTSTSRRRVSTRDTVAKLLKLTSKSSPQQEELTTEGVVEGVCTLPQKQFKNAFDLLNSRSRVSALKGSKHAADVIFHTSDKKFMKLWKTSIHSRDTKRKSHEDKIRKAARAAAIQRQKRMGAYEAFQRQHCGYW